MIDPQAKAILDVMTAGPPLDELGVDGARRWGEQFATPPDPPDERLTIGDTTMGGVPVRAYRPALTTPTPAIVFIHGGGWILGGLDGVDHQCRQLAVHARATVVSVDYRLAPEATHPAALDDCVSVLCWLVEHAADVAIDPDAIAVVGESSGGHLAAATCLRARDLGLPVALQLLVCPVIDPAMDTESWREFGATHLPVASQMSWMWDQYAGSDHIRATDRFVNLPLNVDLSGLPRTIVLTAEYDPLRDEAEHFGNRLAAAGVDADIRREPGQVHTIFGLARAVDACRDALHDTAVEVGDLLARQPDRSAP